MIKNKKMISISFSYEIGGAEISLKNLLKELIKKKLMFIYLPLKTF